MGILAHNTEETAKVPLLATDQNFAAIHSRFKLCLLLKNGEGLCYYGQEASATVADMLAGKAKEIMLDAQKGLADCQAKALELHSQMEAAVLYRKRYDEWTAVSWYTQGEMVMTNYIPFKKPVSRFAVVVKNSMLSLKRLELQTV